MRKMIGRYKFSDSQQLALVHAGLLPSDLSRKSRPLVSRKFSVDEYMGMVDIGVLSKDDRVELVDGVIVEMAPIGKPHGARISIVLQALMDIVPRNIMKYSQSTIRLDDGSGPEPDIALLTPLASMDRENIPGPEDILLVIEIADSSLRADRNQKARRYAASGIPELWIFVLETDEVEVCRQPTPEGYADVQVYHRGDTLTIQELPDVRIAVGELLQ